jgi:hypothetical protein
MSVVTSRDFIWNLILYIAINVKLKRLQNCGTLDFEQTPERFVYKKQAC